jgi:hypothetical protein
MRCLGMRCLGMSCLWYELPGMSCLGMRCVDADPPIELMLKLPLYCEPLYSESFTPYLKICVCLQISNHLREKVRKWYGGNVAQ